MKAPVVFFDIGHTLALTGDLSARRWLGAHLQLSEEEIRQLGRMIMTHPAQSPDELFNAVLPILPRCSKEQIHDNLVQLWYQQMLWIREIPGARRLLEGLKDIGWRLGVISNTWHPAYQGFRQNCPQLATLMDLTILSYQRSCKKPGVEIFQLALQEANCSPETCWMIGDSFELDLEPACRLGMRTGWVLTHPERERGLLTEIRQGVRPGPDFTVQQLDEILPLFREYHVPGAKLGQGNCSSAISPNQLGSTQNGS
ncbi:MAG TPA: hypothetical protein DEO88_07940 [Syntrophobacteraceae bacterium]|nr:hypothetical protein [Syntrophobacteraceae bacterium]